MTNLFIVIIDWTESLNNCLSVDVMFIDFNKVFDKASHFCLIQKLLSFGIIGAVKEWMINFVIWLTIEGEGG